jgi:integrase
MASISKQPNGRRAIQFVGPDRKRRTIRLGKVSEKNAAAVKVRIEDLISAQITGHPPQDATARWVKDLDEKMADKLARVGLIPERENETLGDFLESYFAKRVDVSQSSKVTWGNARRNLCSFFGSDRTVRSIGHGDAEDFRLYLVGEGLADVTIARRIGFARQFFAAMKVRGLITENPFVEVKHTAGSVSDAQYFVKPEEIAQVIEAAPDWIWRTIIALARYGGLRCPSEVLSLRWEGVNWEKGRMTVISPKTAHHPGKGSRVVPIFPELRPYLDEAWSMAEEGQEHVVPRHQDPSFARHGWRNCNLRPAFQKIIQRAGLTPWPRLFQNLRASRETELASKYPVHVVTAWLGNTPAIAMKHYLQVTDDDFDKAAGAAESGAPALHFAVQTVAAGFRHQATDSTQAQAVGDFRRELPPGGDACQDARGDHLRPEMGPQGHPERDEGHPGGGGRGGGLFVLSALQASAVGDRRGRLTADRAAGSPSPVPADPAPRSCTPPARETAGSGISSWHGLTRGICRSGLQ